MEDRNAIIEKNITAVKSMFAEFRDKKTPESCQHLFDAMGTLHDSLREEIQAETTPKIEELMARMESETRLSPQDIQMIRLWVIGDAEAYLKVAPGMEQQQEKLSGLLGTMPEVNPDDPTDMLRMQGLLKEAQETLLDIQKLMEQKSRLERFEKAMENYKPSDASFIKAILDHKLQSPRD